MDINDKLRAFLQIAGQFQLGSLPTEQSHPLTRNLSELAQTDLAAAIARLKQVDCAALQVVLNKADEIIRLSTCIRDALREGNRIFLCGCGATGRLALACEVIWRSVHGSDEVGERVIAFMAGGDIALIRSIENFEDHPEYGAQQLVELGFKSGDLLIACTEGGETPFVIGATLKAASISARAPFFLYCNPDDVLCRTVERSREIIEDARINKMNLTVGPMALAGSTRMQASTVLMLATGCALLYYNSTDCIETEIREFCAFWRDLDLSFLAAFIEKEAACYAEKSYVLYEADDALAITVLTDTTERAPTFSMYPFENAQDTVTDHSLCYLCLPTASQSADAWRLGTQTGSPHARMGRCRWTHLCPAAARLRP